MADKNMKFEDMDGFLPELIAELEKQVPYAAALAQRTTGNRATATTTQMSAQADTPSAGLVLTLWDGASFHELAANHFDAGRLREDALALAKSLAANAPKEKLELDPGEKLVREFEMGSSKPASKVALKDKLAYAQELREALQKASPKVVNAMAVVGDLLTEEVFVNRNKRLKQRLPRVDEIMQVYVAGDDGRTQQLWDGRSVAGGWEKIGAMKKEVGTLVGDAEKLLGAARLEPGFYDVITDNDWSGMLAHEAFGHGTETDMYVKERAAGHHWMGKKVASEITTLFDDPSYQGQSGSFFFDHEGALAVPGKIIDRGVLKQGMTDFYSAGRLGYARTANGRRESWKRKAYARMTNTFFAEGKSSPKDLFAAVENGLYLRYASNGMEDPHGWGIQCEGLWAQKIKNGKLTDEICSPVIMTGFVPDILQSIKMVANDLKITGLGYCGKGHKEIVKNTMGGPHLLFRARLA